MYTEIKETNENDTLDTFERVSGTKHQQQLREKA